MTMKQRDFEEKYGDVVLEARQYWRDLVNSTFDEIGDKGSAVLGDGVMVSLIPPRCRNPRSVMIIPSPYVSMAIGSAHYEVHADTVVEYLKDRGIDAWYCYGFMD